MKKLVYFTMILLILCGIAYGEKWTIDYGNVSDPIRLQTLLINKFDSIETDIRNLKSHSNLGTGKIFYVDSGVGSDTYDGTKPEWAKATLDAAVALCTDNNGDVIYVMQGHNEALTAADGVDIDVAGVTVIGLGNGTDAPTFDYDGANGEFVIGAANVKIYNLRFLPSVNIVTHAIDVEIAGDYACIYNCYFLDGETAGTDEFVDCIQIGTTATDVTIANCTYYCTGANANNFVDLSTATIANPTVINNVIYGTFAEAGIWAGAAVPTNCLIGYNIVSNVSAGQYAIEFQGAATGICIGNSMYTNAAATTLDPGSMMCLENYGTNAIDLSAVRVPALPAIATVTAGSADDILKKLYYVADGTDAYPATVQDDSTLAKIMGIGATATVGTYDNTTDSLEAISVALALGTGATASLVDAKLDHISKTADGGTNVYPDTVAQESVIAYILSSSADPVTTSYNNTTDSLQAIRDRIDALTGLYYTGDCSTNAVTTTAIIANLIGFGEDYFNTDWVMICTYNTSGAGTAPEGEIRDISNYVTASGTFTLASAFTEALTANDKAMVMRREFFTNDMLTLKVTPITGSLATFISGGASSTALGTPCGTDKSLVDALGSDGVALTDGAVSLAGIIGIPTDVDNLVTSANIVENGDGSVFERLEFLQIKTDDILASLGSTGVGVGNVFYVDSVTGSDADSGTTWALAEASLAAAIGDCTANKGDIIFVAPTHAESLAAAQIDVSTTGITIIGLGNGSIRPTITMTNIASSVDVTASNVTIKNIRFYSTTADTTIGVHITGDDVTLEGCEFTDTGGFEFTAAISLGSAADRIIIKNCDFVSTSGAAAAEAILITSGVVDRCSLIENRIFGDYTAAGILSDQINTNMLIEGNKVTNIAAGVHAIELTAAATGFLVNNILYTDAYATGLDPGSLKCIENYFVDAIDEGSYLIPAMGDSTSNYIGIQSANNDAVTTSIVPNKDGSILERLEAQQQAGSPSYNHPNYFVVTADMTSATWNTAATHEIAAVVGNCRIQILAEVTATVVTVGTNGTIALGYEGNTTAIFTAQALDACLTNDILTAVYGAAGTSVASGANTSTTITGGLFDVVVVNGMDIGYTIATNAGTTGSINFHIWWQPLNSAGVVTAGAGGVL